MNRRTKELAAQAGFDFDDYYDSLTQEELIHLVELVRADEREACAKLCDDVANDLGVSLDYKSGAHWCANAIRARATPV